MPIKSKCESCEFFKSHSLFGEKGVEKIGGTCTITNSTTKCVSGNRVITFDLQNQCPIEKIKRYEKLNKCWKLLENYIEKLYLEGENLEYQSKLLLKNILFKMKEFEGGNDE